MWTINGAYPRIGGRYIHPRTEPVLRFRVRGTTFPDSYYSHSGPIYATGRYQFDSSGPNVMHIDYGDGSSESLPFVQSGSIFRLRMSHLGELTNNYDYPGHYYIPGTDNHDALPEHIVTIRFDKPETVTGLIVSETKLYGDFPSDIGLMDGLEVLTLNDTANITGFPLRIGETASLKDITFRNIGSAMEERIPNSLFDMPIESITVTNSVNLSDITSSNFDRIGEWAGTLIFFGADSCKIDQMPLEISLCTNLRSLYVRNNRFSVCPPEINGLPLTELRFVGTNPNIVEWGDFSACSDLVTLGLELNLPGTFTTNIPPWVSSLTKLKKVVAYSTFGHSQARTDTWVDNVYNFVVANALITGTDDDPFRAMDFDLVPTNPSHIPTYNKRPSGIYQQPAGYVQGSNNGTPASPMERIWVLENQYGHTWLLIP